MVRLQEKSLTFLVFVDGNLPNNLRGDETRVRQIILNILSNAVKYTDEGYVSLTVRGTVRPVGNILDLTITIKDTGIGIKPEDRNKLFADYSRLDQRKNRNVEGTGLGLTITKSLCNMMNGSIYFESTYGKGSTFSVAVPQEVEKNLPFARVESAESKNVLVGCLRKDLANSVQETLQNLKTPHVITTSQEDFDTALKSGMDFSHILVHSAIYDNSKDLIQFHSPKCRLALISYAPGGRPGANYTYLSYPLYSLPLADFLNNTQTYSLSQGRQRRERILIPKGRILVVDDLETNLQVASALLSEYGCQIETASNANDAIELVVSRSYDLVFMDHVMPGVDGLEATIRIRNLRDGAFKDLPIVALTANAIIGIKEMFLAHGFNDFLSKPIDLGALENILKRWIPPEKFHILNEETLAAQAAAAAQAEALEAQLQNSSTELHPSESSVVRFTPNRILSLVNSQEETVEEELPTDFMMPEAKVLIVDDLPTNIEVARALISEYGCQIEEALSAREAISMILKTKYDIVFMDHMMPEMDGLEATLFIRGMERGRFRNLPIVALTANLAPGVRETFLRNGFNDFIGKPIDITVLEKVLAKWVPKEKTIYLDKTEFVVEEEERSEASASDSELVAIDSVIEIEEARTHARGEKGYQRIIMVFMGEAETWRNILGNSLIEPNIQEILTILKDMETSASIIGAKALAKLASDLAIAAKNEDLLFVKKNIGRLLNALKAVEDQLEAYLSGNLTSLNTILSKEEGISRESTLRESLDTSSINKTMLSSGVEAVGDTVKPQGDVYSFMGSTVNFLGQDKIPELSFVDFEIGIGRCQKSPERYKRILNIYKQDVLSWLNQLFDQNQKSMDFKQMTISYHAMKSASATIGAMGLSEEAKKMEEASRKGDLDYITNNVDNCKMILQGVLAQIMRYLEE
jgi:CheY-like chemotaxis protein